MAGDAVCALTNGGGYAEFCLVGKKIGDEVEVPIPRGTLKLKIVGIERGAMRDTVGSLEM